MSNDTTCAVDECGKPVKRAGYCYGHYMKNWRYGTPTPEWPDRWDDVTGERFGLLVAQERERDGWSLLCDCGRMTWSRAGDLNRGSKITCGDRTEHYRTMDAGYSAAHQRVRRDRGQIQRQACIDCGAAAQHWSYNHDDPDERVAHGLSANPIAYSLDPAHYSPRCVSCHKRYDLGRIDAARIA